MITEKEPVQLHIPEGRLEFAEPPVIDERHRALMLDENEREFPAEKEWIDWRGPAFGKGEAAEMPWFYEREDNICKIMEWDKTDERILDKLLNYTNKQIDFILSAFAQGDKK